MAAFTIAGITGSTASMLGDLPVTLTAYFIDGSVRVDVVLLPADIFTHTFSIASESGPLEPLAVLEPSSAPQDRAASDVLLIPTVTVTSVSGDILPADFNVSQEDGTALIISEAELDCPGGTLIAGDGSGGATIIANAHDGDVVVCGIAEVEGGNGDPGAGFPVGFTVAGEILPPAALGTAYHFINGEEGNSTEILAPAELPGEVDIIGTRRSPPMTMFDGTNFLERTVDDLVLDGTTLFTISVTINPQLIQLGQDCTIASKNQDVANGYGWRISYVHSTGIVTIKVWEDNVGTDHVQRSTSTGVFLRSRVTFVYNTGALTVYLDGVQDQGAETKVGIATSPNGSNEPFALGADAPSLNPTTGLYRGAIYDFALWDTNLTSTAAAGLVPDGSMITANAADLQVWWSSFTILASGVNASFQSWIDEQASLALTPADVAGFNPIFALESLAGLPGSAPLPITHDWGTALQDSRFDIPPNQGLSALYGFDITNTWRLWEAGALSPIVINFKRERGDFTCLAIVHRPDGANATTVMRVFGVRVENQVSAGVSTFFIIKGIDDVSPTNRRIDYNAGLPDGRDLLGAAPTTIIRTAVKFVIVRYNSLDDEVDLLLPGFPRFVPTNDISTAAFETGEELEIAGLLDFQRAIFIPACLGSDQIDEILNSFQPQPVFNTGIQQSFDFNKHNPLVTLPRDLHNPPFEDAVTDEKLQAATTATTALGRLLYAGPPGGLATGTVNLSIPSTGGPTQFLTYVDDGGGSWTATLGSPAATGGSINYTGTQATGSVTIAAGNVSAGDTVTLIDAFGFTQGYEFVVGAPSGSNAAGNHQVTIGATNILSAANLAQAIKDTIAVLGVTAVQASNVVNLTQVEPVIDGNTTVTVVGANLSKVDFAGGLTAGDWSITITGGGDEFDTARVDGTVDYTWNSEGTTRNAAFVDFDNLDILVTNIFRVGFGEASRLLPFTDAPFIIKDGGEDITGGGGAGVFLDPAPTVVSVTADLTHQVFATANAGPTDAGDLITWWEVELASGNTEMFIQADFTRPNAFASNRNHSDTFLIPEGQNFQNKRIRFVIIAVDDGAQEWRSLFFRMEGENFDNAPPTVITQTIVQGGIGAAAGDLLTIEERGPLVLSTPAAPRARLAPVASNSRYKFTPLFEGTRGLEYGLMSVLEDFATVGREFRVHRVKSADVGFLDRIAVDFYGDGFEWAWWVIAYANRIVDPDFDMFEDQELVIPDRATIQRFQARKPATFVNPVGL